MLQATKTTQKGAIAKYSTNEQRKKTKSVKLRNQTQKKGRITKQSKKSGLTKEKTEYNCKHKEDITLHYITIIIHHIITIIYFFITIIIFITNLTLISNPKHLNILIYLNLS